MNLSRYEQETIILFNEGEKTARIETFNGKLKRRLAEIYKERPEEMKFEGEDKHGAATYEFPKTWIRINPSFKREMTDEQRADIGKRLKHAR